MIIYKTLQGFATLRFDDDNEEKAFFKWITEFGQSEFLRWRMAGENDGQST
jgi:hypothetical protein